MRFEQLSAFVETAKYHSMSIAAEKLYVTPQNISKSIAQLEQEIGCHLFTRTRQGVILTPHGQEAYDVAVEILERVQHLSTGLRDEKANQKITGNLKIATALSLSLFLAATVADFINVYPNISIAMLEHESEPILNKGEHFLFLSLYENEIDQYDKPEIRQNYHLYFLRKETFRLFVNKRSALAKRKMISSKLLAATPLVVYAPKQAENFWAETLFQKLSITPDKFFKTSNYNFCFQQIVIGNYAALSTHMLYNFCPASFLSEITSIPLSQKIALFHYVLVKKEDFPTASALFLEQLQNYFQKDFVQIF